MMMMMQAVAKGDRGVKRANKARVEGGGGGGGEERDDVSAMSQTSTSNVSDDDVSIDADAKKTTTLQGMMMSTNPLSPLLPPPTAIDTSTNYPYHNYLKSLPRWKWLNADTLPVRKSMLSDAEGDLLLYSSRHIILHNLSM